MKSEQHHIIIPAVLEKTFQDIITAIARVSAKSQHVQIDIVDGVFTGNPTWPFFDMNEVHHVRTVLETVPTTYELDLMIEKPEKTLPLWLSTSAQRLIFHLGSTQEMERCLTETKKSGKEVVVALLPQHDVTALVAWRDLLDGVQCMGIETIGQQGIPFSERVFDTIRAVQTIIPTVPIGVDGGVSLDTIVRLRDAGVTRFAIGSALFQADDIGSALDAFANAVITPR